MRRAATWSPKPKGRAELILSLLSQDGMPGTLSHPTVRAAAASAVQNMRLGAVAVDALRAPAVPSAQATPPNWPALQTWWPTCRSTASWRRPTSRVCIAEVSSQTHDDLISLCRPPESLKLIRASHAESLHSALPHSFPVTVISHSSVLYISMDETSSWSVIWRGFIIQINKSDNHFSNNNCVINSKHFLWLTCFLSSLVYMLL